MKAAGASATTPSAPRRAAPRSATDQPRAMSALDTPPPKKLPRSAARKGTQKPAAVSSMPKPRVDEEDREPVGDHEPHRIGQAAAAMVPQVWGERRGRRAECGVVSPAERCGRFGCAILGEHRALLVADARMLIRRIVAAPPGEEPQEAEGARDQEGRAPTAESMSARPRARVRSRRRPTSRCRRAPPPSRVRAAGTTPRPPSSPPASSRPRPRRAGTASRRSPTGSLASDVAWPTVEYQTTAERQSRPAAQAIDEPARHRLHHRVGDAERDHDEREILVRPVVLGLQDGRQHAQRLAVDVVDDRRPEQERSDEPAEVTTHHGITRTRSGTGRMLTRASDAIFRVRVRPHRAPRTAPILTRQRRCRIVGCSVST